MEARHVIECNTGERQLMLDKLNIARATIHLLLEKGQEKDIHNGLLGVLTTVKTLESLFK